MRVLIQRVLRASVEIDGKAFSQIGAGMLLFVGIEENDGDEDIEWLAGKICRLRIFDDRNADGESYSDKVGYDILQTGGEVLVVSQFTLHASTRKGNRPSYIRSARPEISGPLYERFVARLSRELGDMEGKVLGANNGEQSESNGNEGETAERGRKVKTGVFGADMKVSLTNDGPVTIWLDSKNRE